MLLIVITTLLIAIGLGNTSQIYLLPENWGSLKPNGSSTTVDKKTNTLYLPTITPTLLIRITSITLLFSAVLSFNCLYTKAIGSGLGLYSGLFNVTNISQSIEVFLLLIGAFILLGYSSEKGNVLDYQVEKGIDNLKNLSTTISEYSLIILFTTIGATFLISSSDLVSMYLSIELQSFAVYILAAIYRNSESATSAGLKYFLLGALSSALILLGSSLIYAYAGTTNLEGIYMMGSVVNSDLTYMDGGSAEASAEKTNNIIVLGILIISVGFLFKVAAAPFHNWAPDVYDGVPTIVTTWLTVMPKISIFIFLLELVSLSNLDSYNVLKTLFLSTSLLSLVIGTLVGLAQNRLKRLLAYSTISHVGFLLLALSVNSEDSISSFLFYIIQYSITNLNTFFIILALGYLLSHSKDRPLTSINSNQLKDISFIAELKGQFKTNPALTLSLALCLFSMAGIPPLIGFFAKYLVLYSAIENGYYFLALIGILASVVSASYYLRVIKVMFMEATESKSKNQTPENWGNLNLQQNDYKNTNQKNKVLTSAHSYIIAILTLFITLFILSPSLLLNSSNLLALSLFTA